MQLTTCRLYCGIFCCCCWIFCCCCCCWCRPVWGVFRVAGWWAALFLQDELFTDQINFRLNFYTHFFLAEKRERERERHRKLVVLHNYGGCSVPFYSGDLAVTRSMRLACSAFDYSQGMLDIRFFLVTLFRSSHWPRRFARPAWQAVLVRYTLYSIQLDRSPTLQKKSFKALAVYRSVSLAYDWLSRPLIKTPLIPPEHYKFVGKVVCQISVGRVHHRPKINCIRRWFPFFFGGRWWKTFREIDCLSICWALGEQPAYWPDGRGKALKAL